MCLTCNADQHPAAGLDGAEHPNQEQEGKPSQPKHPGDSTHGGGRAEVGSRSDDRRPRPPPGLRKSGANRGMEGVEWKEEKTGHNQFVLVGMLGRPNHVRPNVTVCCWLLFTWGLFGWCLGMLVTQ